MFTKVSVIRLKRHLTLLRQQIRLRHAVDVPASSLTPFVKKKPGFPAMPELLLITSARN